ncbi:MAG: hypothetical protein J0H67_12035 [Rhodospirillales bacterium]|nr:hypothetical protein [Rhodospirillales bacterium]MBN8897201.1 hypothetical protein [Rhodospirillales bacterium]
MHPVPDLPWPQDLFAPHAQRPDATGTDRLYVTARETELNHWSPVRLNPVHDSRDTMQ